MLPYDPSAKRLGGYLVDAGLLQPHQVEVALRDQQATGMRFGDIVVARGWLRRKTIEYFVKKIVDLERKAGEPLSMELIENRIVRNRAW
ncbi:MAG: hypothetical protein KME35_11075 [Aphanocapsa sp. GSE-SYN-MK-11-07L]|nr:hypothetical protein [Aphanocapsa sp. GSE-SYN-MK-11-07L]